VRGLHRLARRRARRSSAPPCRARPRHGRRPPCPGALHGARVRDRGVDRRRLRIRHARWRRAAHRPARRLRPHHQHGHLLPPCPRRRRALHRVGRRRRRRRAARAARHRLRHAGRQAHRPRRQHGALRVTPRRVPTPRRGRSAARDRRPCGGSCRHRHPPRRPRHAPSAAPRAPRPRDGASRRSRSVTHAVAHRYRLARSLPQHRRDHHLPRRGRRRPRRPLRRIAPRDTSALGGEQRRRRRVRPVGGGATPGRPRGDHPAHGCRRPGPSRSSRGPLHRRGAPTNRGQRHRCLLVGLPRQPAIDRRVPARPRGRSRLGRLGRPHPADVALQEGYDQLAAWLRSKGAKRMADLA